MGSVASNWIGHGRGIVHKIPPMHIVNKIIAIFIIAVARDLAGIRPNLVDQVRMVDLDTGIHDANQHFTRIAVERGKLLPGVWHVQIPLVPHFTPQCIIRDRLASPPRRGKKLTIFRLRQLIDLVQLRKFEGVTILLLDGFQGNIGGILALVAIHFGDVHVEFGQVVPGCDAQLLVGPQLVPHCTSSHASKASVGRRIRLELNYDLRDAAIAELFPGARLNLHALRLISGHGHVHGDSSKSGERDNSSQTQAFWKANHHSRNLLLTCRQLHLGRQQ
mmetsp:Transcript_94699/g.197860  ORF Transcript_94699/g.197860 Transcript_94699/m.197860 type:complete len:276 (+) Transcript_94699:920-1747(+)